MDEKPHETHGPTHGPSKMAEQARAGVQINPANPAYAAYMKALAEEQQAQKKPE